MRFFLKLSSIALISILLLSTLIFLSNYSNIDKSSWLEITDSQKILISPISNPFLSNKKPNENIEDLQEEEFNKNPSKVNYCLNGKSPSILTKREMLDEFISGPCSPIVLVPGIMGTMLSVQINCTLLKSKNPEIFSNCGWSTCSWSLFKYKPDSEYVLWVPGIDSPMSIFTPYSSKSKCFGGLIELKFNKTENDRKLRYKSNEGLNVTWFGNTPESVKKSSCGKIAVENLFNFPYAPCSFKGFSGLNRFLVKLGYVSGITFQPVPYDFRKSSYHAEANYSIERSISSMFSLTGKKVIVVAHSLGNIYSMNFFNNISSEFKEKKILQYVAVASPFVGSPKTLKVEIGGDSEMFYYNSVGLNYEGQKGFLGTSPGLFAAFPMDSYFRFKNEPWMKDLIERIENEEKFPPEDSNSREFWEKEKNNKVKWFPNPLEKCVNGKIGLKDEFCRINMIDMKKHPILTVKGENFFANRRDMNRIINKYVKFSKNSLDLYEDGLKSEMYLLKNPEVATTIVYGSFSKTNYGIIYNEDPSLKIKKTHDFYFPDKIKNVPGDLTIPTSSSILPMAKWSYEYEEKLKGNKKFANAKPVKVAEMCSIYNNKKGFYDVELEGKMKEVNKNEYIGLDCECAYKKKKLDICNHSCMPNEKSFRYLLFDILNANQQVKKENTEGNFLEDQDLEMLQEECLALRLDYKVKNVLDRFQRPILKKIIDN